MSLLAKSSPGSTAKSFVLSRERACHLPPPLAFLMPQVPALLLGPEPTTPTLRAVLPRFNEASQDPSSSFSESLTLLLPLPLKYTIRTARQDLLPVSIWVSVSSEAVNVN